MRISNHIDFLLATLIVVIAFFLSFAIYTRMMTLNSFMGPYRFSHWLSIIGTIYIALATPLFVVLKRVFHANWSRLFRFHMFGNLIFFALISMHFAVQVGRPADRYPVLGTGLAMFVAMALQVASGFTQRFRSQGRWYEKLVNARANQFIHAGLVVVFYIVIVFHVLHGLGIT